MASRFFSPDNSRPAVVVGQMVVVAAAYYASARLGLLREVVVDGAVVTPLWLPAGVALSSFLYLGLRMLPGVAAGALLSVATISDALGPSDIAIVAGNTLAPLCSFLLLRRMGFRMELNRLRDGAALVFLGAVAGMLVSATVGAGVLTLTGKLPHSQFWRVWLAWWAGDSLGVLVVTPLLLVLRRLRRPRSSDRWVEATVLLVTAVPLNLLATRSSFSFLFLTFPLVIWAALRFQLPGSAPCAALASVLAVLSATDGIGPFAGQTLFEVTATVAAFNGAVALTALLLAAIVTEQQNITRKIERACGELADLVEQLTPGVEQPRPPSAGPPPVGDSDS
ncbi:MASE1 domain-containing protein [Streptomyces sp. NBC_00344]|uniref:MASE1 domain-containing protein n=1 Tax=Streptomyces sp. NBC_00344 TaxID=2975720 RepID=UPI002E1F37B3